MDVFVWGPVVSVLSALLWMWCQQWLAERGRYSFLEAKLLGIDCTTCGTQLRSGKWCVTCGTFNPGRAATSSADGSPGVTVGISTRTMRGSALPSTARLERSRISPP
jgi:hypothetical protein